ncbi:MAG TPA: serine/threonine-protein kinase [Kofleriaceae bacterium]|nr:serine/threonine-protein kinase [Kofleriaceae bacterium]
MIEQTLSNYRVRAKLGEGGMGEVYLAEHVMMGKQAAIKTLRREYCANSEVVSRFFNEARSATMVKHPGIVDIYDFGHHADGSAYIIMELLEGQELSKRLAGGKQLPAAEIAELGAQVADALAAAHAAGIVHRDLKPDNIFLCPDAAVFGGHRVKLLDFGIAKLTSDQMAVTAKTRTGTLMGTPSYMAPEQCRGAGDVDHRADIYALGCILFEMTCGQVPFISPGVGDLLIAHITEPPPSVKDFRADAEPGLAKLIATLLAKDPDHRIQQVSDVAEILRGRRSGVRWPSETAAVALGTFPPGTEATLPPTEAPRRLRRWPFVALGGVVIACAVTLAVELSGGSTDATTDTASTAQGDLTTDVSRAAEAAPDPDPDPDDSLARRDDKPPTTPPAPSRVTLELFSSPPHATIYRVVDGVRIGQTPWKRQYPSSEGALDLILRLDGHKSRQISLSLTSDAKETITLDPVPAPDGKRKRRHKPPDGAKSRESTQPVASPAAKPDPTPVKDNRHWGELAP